MASRLLIYLVSLLLSLHTPVAFSLDLESAPSSITNVYSDIDMRLKLAVKPNEKACSGDQCVANKAFDAQVQKLGMRLSAAAYKTYPGLEKKVAGFSFSVAEKKAAGIASTGTGKIVIFRGIQNLELSDDALSFILAREMGHVIGRHHNRNGTTKILFSILASVVFPAATLLSASNVAAQATTTAVTSIASTATSFIGSEVAISKIKPNQLMEADNIAIKLLETQNWDMSSVANMLQFEDVDKNGWLKDLQISVAYIDSLKENETPVQSTQQP